MAKRKGTKRQKTSNGRQNTKQTTKYLATSTPLSTGVNSGAPEGWEASAPLGVNMPAESEVKLG